MPDIRDIKEIESVFYSFGEIAIFVSILLLLLGSILGIIFYLRRRKKKQKPTAIELAHVIALRELEKLSKTALLEKKQYKKYFFRQTEIFKTYLESQFRIDTLEKTTEELQREITACSELNGHSKELITFFIDTDVIKFSTFLPEDTRIKNLAEYPKIFITTTLPKTQL